MTTHRDCKIGTAADSTAEFPIQKLGKKIKKGKKKKPIVRYDTGENLGVSMAESGTIPREDEAKCAANKAVEGGEKGPNAINPDSVTSNGRDIPVTGQPAMGRPAWPWLTYR